jgi:hypothetical protein
MVEDTKVVDGEAADCLAESEDFGVLISMKGE